MLPAAKRKGITEDDVYALLTRAAIGAIVGARIAYVINHLGDYSHPLDVFKIWEGGISLLGGFIGAIALALPEMRNRRLSFWKVMDAAAPGMALGVIIGRIGDLVVADHLGKPTSFVLGYRCPALGVDTASPCVAGPRGVVYQPALIDFVLTVVLLAVLLRLRRKERWDGFLIIVFTVAYGLFRILEDFMRVDETHGTGLTGSQWTSVVLVLLAGAWLAFRHRTPGWGRWDERPAEEPEEPPTMAFPPEREE
jgi:phosphatidylglycerol:prolipoprotein diacylglycerol transferase